MYNASVDPHCYLGTTILKNLANIQKPKELRQFELLMTSQRFLEPQPNGRLSASHYYAIHHHLFQDVYTWAGKPRSVRISKGKSVFCYPEHIASEMKRVFTELRLQNYLRNLSSGEFAKHAAHFLAELNAIHAFRDGNGRAQLAFMTMVATRADHSLNLSKLHKTRFLKAVIASFSGKEYLLATEFLTLIN
jgi:cell filamentation protein